MKTICIPSTPTGLGGPATFLRHLTKTFAESDINILNEPTNDPINAILVIQSTRHLPWLLKQKRRGTPIVQRLNGIKGYSDDPSITSKTRWNNWARNSTTNFIRRHLASSVIYQSKFSQQIWEQRYGSTNANIHVVYNGCEITPLEYESPAPTNTSRAIVLVVEAGLNEPGVLEKITGTWEALQRKNFDVEFRVAGRLTQSSQSRLPDPQNFHYLGQLSPADVRGEMERATVLLSPETAPACPNTVLEAMSAKLPVVGFNSGAILELIDDPTLIIGEQGLYTNPSIADLELIADAVITATQQRETLADVAYTRAKELFDINIISRSYAEVLGV
jgi:glycosyltransferase involved in cell wall biosynthesis